MMSQIPDMSDADFSPCRTWRYRLRRRWTEGPTLTFILLNPSTADETVPDPTVTRCIGYAQAWGYGGLVLGNLFAFRATAPKVMKAAPDPVGPDNDDWLDRIASEAGQDNLVLGWGAHGCHQRRSAAVMARLLDAGHTPKALTRTATGEPGHPLYLRADLQPFFLDR